MNHACGDCARTDIVCLTPGIAAMNRVSATEHDARHAVRRDSTVQLADALRYARMADRWWDADGPFWPLHRLNRLRLEYLARRFANREGADPSRPLAGLDCLDIGCGGGLLAEGLARLGASVTGIDVVEANLLAARSHARGAGLAIDYRYLTAGDLADDGRRFDLVLNMEVVEHVDDFHRFMDQCCQLVRPGGHMAVATINRTLASFAAAIVGAEYVMRWLPRGTHRWRDFRQPREVEARLEAGGLEIHERRGVRVNPLTRRFSLTRSMRVNYMLLAHKPRPTLTPIH